MTAEPLELGTIVTLLGPTLGGIAGISNVVLSGFDRAARRVTAAVDVRDTLRLSLTKAAGHRTLRKSKAMREQLERADSVVLYECAMFDQAVRDRWKSRENRPRWFVFIGLLLVLAFVAIVLITFAGGRQFDPVVINFTYVAYVTGCLLVGIGGTDFAINRARTDVRKHLVELGVLDLSKRIAARSPDRR